MAAFFGSSENHFLEVFDIGAKTSIRFASAYCTLDFDTIPDIEFTLGQMVTIRGSLSTRH